MEKDTKRPESSLGKHYEKKMFAFISLKCLLDTNMTDFWISSNLSSIDKFDDVILHAEFKDDKKEYFFIQIKHKKNCNKPIVADMLCTTKKDFDLQKYQTAYNEMVEKKIINDIEATNLIMLNNCNIELNYKNDKVAFEQIDSLKVRKFLSGKNSRAYQITNKTEELTTEFLSHFYFYPEQYELEEIQKNIQELLGVDTIVDEIMQYFYVQSEKPGILTKFDIKTKVLSILFGHFKVPNVDPQNSSLMETLKKFDVTLISDNISENKLWSEIFFEIQEYYKEKELNFEQNWKDPLPEEIQDEIKKLNKSWQHEHICLKTLYLYMVAHSLIPFYNQTNSKLSDKNIYSLLSKLQVFSVIYQTDNQPIEFPKKIKLFKTMDDLDEKTFKDQVQSIFISFRNQSKISLDSLKLGKDTRQHITSNQFIQLINSTVQIRYNSQNCDEIYVGRKLKWFIVELEFENVISNQNCLYVICNVPSNKRISQQFRDTIRYKKFTTYFIDEHSCNLWTTEEPYNFKLFKDLKDEAKSRRKNIYIFQYEDNLNKSLNPNKKTILLNLLYTNERVENLRKYLREQSIEDCELIQKLKFSHVNIICNIAGMGKSMLLRYLLRTFQDNWNVYIELNKHIHALNKIKNFKEFVNFLFDNKLMGSVSSTFQNMFKILFESYIKQKKLVLLIDDFEEIKNKKIMTIFKELAQKGIRLWIVARPSMKEEYENYFGTFSLELIEFSENDQLKFFKNFFKNENNNWKERKDKLKIIKKITNKLEKSFIGICQQTMMLAEILQANPEIKNIRTNELYDKFINETIDKNYNKNQQFIVRTLSKLALTIFFTKSFLSQIFDWNEFKCDVEVFKNENSKNPFIEFTAEWDVVFTHKTYAEFLAAKWIAETARKQILKETPINVAPLIQFLYCHEMANVRWFFDLIIMQMETKKYVIDFLSSKITFTTDILGRNKYHYSMTYGEQFDLYTTLQIENVLHYNEEHVELEHTSNKILVKVPEIIRENRIRQFKLPFNSVIVDNKPSDYGSQLTKYSSKVKNFTVTSADGTIVKEINIPQTVLPYILNKINLENLLIFLPDNLLNLYPLYCGLLAGCLNEIDEVMNNELVYSFVTLLNLDKKCYFILYHSIKNGLCNILRKLLPIPSLKKEALMVRDAITDMSLLHLAVSYRKNNCVKEILDLYKPEYFGQDKNGNTPLHLCGGWNNVEILNMFIMSSDIDYLNLQNDVGHTALYCYTKHQHTDCIELLLQNLDKNCIDVSEKNTNNSPFILSILNKNIEIAKMLLKAGADVNFSNEKGMTALHIAVVRSNTEFVKDLIKWGANTNSKSKIGFTPLIIAARLGNLKLVNLLANESTINICDKNKWTALHHAVKTGKFKVVNILLKKKAEINSKNKKGNTPLIIACLKNFPKIVDILLKNNAEHHHISKFKKNTALSICKEKNHVDCLNIIETHLSNKRETNFLNFF